MDITIKPLTAARLDDYLFFFDHITFGEHPDWSACYCFESHFVGTKEQWNKEENRSSVIKYISENKMRGYLAYSGNKPVGWCNANNRSNYQRLLKYEEMIGNPEDQVCSIVCFLIDPDYRRKGIAQKLLEQICLDYKLQNYDYIEAYPRKGQLSCENHYKGPLKLYEKFGFKIEKEYDDYFVVRKRLG
ncbi:MAG: GNAT family N-acetyltransferase [Mangrovibacterium sp.]